MRNFLSLSLDSIIFCDPAQNVFAHDQQLNIVDVDFCKTHLLLIVRNGRKYEMYSLSLPLGNDKVMRFSDPVKHVNKFDVQFMLFLTVPLH